MSTDGAYHHYNPDKPKPRIQLDSLTMTKLDQLSQKNDALATCVYHRLQEYSGWGFDTALSLCEKDLERNQELSKKLDVIHKDRERQKERAAQDQIRRAIKTDKEDKQRQIALDQKLKQYQPDKPTIPFTPKIVERAFCCFCNEYHPTQIMTRPGEIKNFSLDSYHVTDRMRVNSEGYDRIPTDKERCVFAIMQNRGCDQDEAERKCDQLLNNPLVINRYIRNPKHEQVTKQTEEDRYVAKTVATMNIHPELAKQAYDQICDERTASIIKLIRTGKLNRGSVKRRL